MIFYRGRLKWAGRPDSAIAGSRRPISETYLRPRQRVSIIFEVKPRMTNAIFETGGKQYRVKEGDVIFIERLQAESDETVTFENVLAITSDDDTKIGAPYVEGAAVEATVVKNGKSKKIIVYKMRPKKGYRRKQGHRQPYTKIQIEKITV